MKLKVWLIAGGIALSQIGISFLISPPLKLARSVEPQPSTPIVPNSSPPPAVKSALLVAQEPPVPTVSPDNALGKQLLQEVTQCILGKATSLPAQPTLEALQGFSMECMYSVVLLDETGKIRPDANDRMAALIGATGVVQPRPVAQGQATLSMQRLNGMGIFTVPVTIAGQSQPFLFDTGAGMSIVDTQLAQQLKLNGTALPKGVLQNFVVGDECADITAAIHPLPTVVVGSAQVDGITGLGLPRSSIPGNVAGVLGIDFLSGFDIVLSPQNAQLQLMPPSTPTQTGVPLVGKFGLMTTQVYINGQGPFTFALDTGAEWMVVSDRLARQLTVDVDKAEEVDVVGFCGTEKGKQIRLTEVRMQTHQVTDLDTVILENDLLDVAGVEGIVGQNFLNHYNQHWRFGKPDALGFPKDGSLELSQP